MISLKIDFKTQPHDFLSTMLCSGNWYPEEHFKRRLRNIYLILNNRLLFQLILYYSSYEAFICTKHILFYSDATKKYSYSLLVNKSLKNIVNLSFIILTSYILIYTCLFVIIRYTCTLLNLKKKYTNIIFFMSMFRYRTVSIN